MTWETAADRIDFLNARRVLLLGDQEGTSTEAYGEYEKALQDDGHEVARYNPTLDPFLGRTSLRWQLRYLIDEAQGVAVIPKSTHPESDLLVAVGHALNLPVFDADTRCTVRPTDHSASKEAVRVVMEAVQGALSAL